VAKDPSKFASVWLARKWIADSVQGDKPTPTWNTGADHDIWAQLERTFAYRLHLDHLLSTLTISPRVRNNFQKYQSSAFHGLYSADSEFDIESPEMFGPLWYVRYPHTASWDKSLNLGAWRTDASVAPSTRQYLALRVSWTDDKWVNPP
jgi:hypothetical protein